eukprot:TRINITY_DN19622_c0_g1_i2.p1 TRINITY_DN19622_c0_g1~~TRINITY_DN19622_c0_g1_i2.p1  ORF type:complete len:429 (+),score=83.47 TRINITY_DN19622_c0_g1_i2:28-1287(+)
MLTRRQPMREEQALLQSVFVPGYVMLSKLGSGGQADVFQAARRSYRGDNGFEATRVAVKVFHGKRAERSLEIERRFLAAVQGHCNIVRMVESFQSDPWVNALVLELCDTDLQVLCSLRNLSEPDVVHITRGALRALEHMHGLQIVHRDVKPENVAITDDGSARLVDFGVAADLSDSVEMNRRCGSLEYLAPEVFTKKGYGLPVDMFAFGATLYHVLGKQFPLATPGMTYQAAAAKSTRYKLSFGSNFDHVGNETIKIILWLMHPCDTWRPDASFALTCPPFATCLQVQDDHETPSFETQLQARVAAEMVAHPPAQQKVGSARPTPLRQFKENASRLDAPDSNVSTSDTLPVVAAVDFDGSHARAPSEVEKPSHASPDSEATIQAASLAERERRRLQDALRKSGVLDASFANVSVEAIVY